MKTDLHLSFQLYAVLQLIDEYTNRWIGVARVRMYTDHPAQILRKEDGIYAILNVAEEKLRIQVDVPGYFSETRVLQKTGGSILPIRMTPCGSFPHRNPHAAQTYFSGIAKPCAYVRLYCPVQYCWIRPAARQREDTLVLESSNFPYASAGRQLLVTDRNGKQESVTTRADDSDGGVSKIFVTTAPLRQIHREDIAEIRPIFCARANQNGAFLILAEYAEREALSEQAVFLAEDDSPIAAKFQQDAARDYVIHCEWEE